MSRCFQYPPPGFSPDTASNYTLIESIKLQRDKERVKSERKKEKKREKKERNREKKEKAKQESSCSRYGKLISGGDNRELKTRYLQKDIEDEDRLEDSSLSEEHGQPVCSQDSSYLSDSTKNNNKRKRSTSPSNGIHANGTVVRIRLSPHKHGQRDISTKEDCFTESAKHDAEGCIRTSAERISPLLKTNNKQLSPFTLVSEPHSLSSGQTEPYAEDKTTPPCSKMHENNIELEYKNLIKNCIPPSLHYDFDDQDWLFQRKHKHVRVKEKGEDSSNMSCGTFALLPRAQYFDDADLYAFPFTVLF